MESLFVRVMTGGFCSSVGRCNILSPLQAALNHSIIAGGEEVKRNIVPPLSTIQKFWSHFIKESLYCSTAKMASADTSLPLTRLPVSLLLRNEVDDSHTSPNASYGTADHI